MKLYASLGAIILGIIIISSIIFIRPDQDSFIGKDAYFYLRLAERPSLTDDLSYGGRVAAYNWGLPMVLNLGLDTLPQMLPILAGAGTLVMLYLLLRRFEIREKWMALILLSISPPFLFMFTSLNKYFMTVFLGMLGFYLLSSEKGIVKWIALVPFMLMPMFNITMAILIAVLVLLYTYFNQKGEMLQGFVAAAVIAAVSGAYYLYFVSLAGMPVEPFFKVMPEGINFKLQLWVSDFGGKFGFGIFSLILAVFGMISVWKNKYQNKFYFFGIMALLISSFIWPEAIFLLNFFFVVLAMLGIIYLLTKEWQNQVIKKFTVLILICGLIFSGLSHANRIIDSGPHENLLSSMKFLTRQDPGTVFADYTLGSMINYAKKKNVMDANFRFAPGMNERWADSQKLFFTRDLKDAVTVIEKYDIGYIWIDEESRAKLWSHDEEGLLFILKYNPDFVRIYDRGGVGIWRVSLPENVTGS